MVINKSTLTNTLLGLYNVQEFPTDCAFSVTIQLSKSQENTMFVNSNSGSTIVSLFSSSSGSSGSSTIGGGNNSTLTVLFSKINQVGGDVNEISNSPPDK